MPRLNLLVLRAMEPARLASFYTHLGLSFTLHRHGSGPEHYASEGGGVVFEIYPALDKSGTTHAVRLGFEVTDIHATVALLANHGAKVIKPPSSSEWGTRAVLEDPEGHKLELLATEQSQL